MNGWHFLPADRRMTNGDGRIVRVGRTYKVKGQPELCERGLHACKRLIDALSYAPGPVLCKVRLGGTILHGDDKSVATERTVLAMADVTDILRLFARRTAWDVWKQHFTTDPSDDKYGAVVRWLRDGREEDRSAAESAARSAKSAAWSAAWTAVGAAARSAAESAARSAKSAAWSAARAAAWSAAWSAANRRLLAMVRRAEWRTA